MSLDAISFGIRAHGGAAAIALASVPEASDASDADAHIAEQQDVLASRNGDADAYARLMRRYHDQVAARMWKFTRDRARFEELVHDVFVEVYLALPNYREMGAFGAWLNRIATRTGYRFWKRRKSARRELSLDHWDGADERTLEQTDSDWAAERLHGLLAQLRPRDRLVLTLMYWEGCSVAETAEQTGWSQAMVKVQAHRARKRLRKLLDRQTDQGEAT